MNKSERFANFFIFILCTFIFKINFKINQKKQLINFTFTVYDLILQKIIIQKQWINRKEKQQLLHLDQVVIPWFYLRSVLAEFVHEWNKIGGLIYSTDSLVL